MKLLLLTTTDLRAQRREDLARLFGSLEKARAAGLDVEHRILAQNAPSSTELDLKPPDFARIAAIAGRVSLSAARNLLLAELDPRRLDDAGVILGFPDDDCWYPEGFLSRLVEAFSADPRLDLLVCGFGAAPHAWNPDLTPLRPATFRDVVRRTSSNNFFVRGPLAAHVGVFDPALGLGTTAGSGEDTEYALHAYFGGRACALADAPLVGHPENSLSKISGYYRGDLAVLARFARRSPAAFAEFVRKIAVGIYLTGRRRMSLRDYLDALVFGMREFGAPSMRVQDAP